MPDREAVALADPEQAGGGRRAGGLLLMPRLEHRRCLRRPTGFASVSSQVRSPAYDQPPTEALDAATYPMGSGPACWEPWTRGFVRPARAGRARLLTSSQENR